MMKKIDKLRFYWNYDSWKIEGDPTNITMTTEGVVNTIGRRLDQLIDAVNEHEKRLADLEGLVASMKKSIQEKLEQAIFPLDMSIKEASYLVNGEIPPKRGSKPSFSQQVSTVLSTLEFHDDYSYDDALDAIVALAEEYYGKEQDNGKRD